MRAIFNEELQQVAEDLTSMAAAVHDAVEDAGRALFEGNIELAQDVIDGDAHIDALEHSINNQCVILLAKQSPVATDLRIVVSTMSIASLLERIGDLARHIAETARSTYPDSPLAPQVKDIFVQMQDFAERTTSTLSDLMTSHDEKAAQRLILSDDTMDKLFESVYTIARSDKWTATTDQTIDSVLLSRYYERIGDHSVSIGRRLVYMVSGFDPSKDPSRFIGVDSDGD
ncbi:phosphate transport system regulatory protein PhoU [Alloscardovia macacae]|uniref:Phosphate-specific transport system accessory protein PhoU n=1 Tax=Alloscardovia macacae TaxID=1160091 RepID=A0A1Y2SWM2_9BIFI|nr:phosphate signaling complex protein PhoU [Alloscardovia macacae]OTA26556.1 phosphate transport system regulatory protein PhoU [Alloscardovia macacae]OTA29055.1 phosphate transport system regulatory protein PhoU [Alloscardovia macacae]